MYEKECDWLLNEMIKQRDERGIHQHTINNLFNDFTVKGIDCDKSALCNAVSILKTNGYVQLAEDYISTIPNDLQFHITHSGIAFISTQSYQNEKIRTEQDKIKLQQDITINSWLIRTKWLPLILSAVSIVLSIITLIAKK